MSRPISDTEIENFLDEALPVDEMARIEETLRNDESLLDRVSAINARRDAGLHSVGAIWRRHRLSCPSRQDLGSYLLGVLEADVAGYVKFHLEVIGCRACQANLEDLRQQQSEASEVAQQRRRKYFQSSAGFLPNR